MKVVNQKHYKNKPSKKNFCITPYILLPIFFSPSSILLSFSSYYPGPYIEGQWVYGGICRETKPWFFDPVGQRNLDTLLPIIRAHILPGTHVVSDMWKAYDCLSVNHSLNFVDPNTGAQMHVGESNEVSLVQEHTNISSKAIYRNGCGSSTMGMIHLDTLSSISPSCMKYANMRKMFVVPLQVLFVIFMEERNKIRFYCMGLNLSIRKSKGKNAE